MPELEKQPPLSTLVQFKKAPVSWEITQDVVTKLEKMLGGKIVTYYTSSGWNIAQDDVKYFYAHLKKIGYQKKLFFVLYSFGGDGQSALRIASLLNSFCDELYVVIPEAAASAATMLSLAADALIMTPLSYLTAVDTSLIHPLNPKDTRGFPVSVELDQVQRALNFLHGDGKVGGDLEIYKTIFSYMHPVALGAVERSKSLSEMLCKQIMSLPKKTKLSDEKIEKIVTKLNTFYPAHSFPITREKAKELGLNVVYAEKELDDLLWNLIIVYRFITDPVRTTVGDNFQHTETNIKIIESIGSSIILNNIFERRLDPIIKGWSTITDEFSWLSYFMKEEDGKMVLKRSKLDF